MKELLILPIVIACIARTVVFEEVFRELREVCQQRSHNCQGIVARKFFYLFTCEYCFSHYVTALILMITHVKVLYTDWRGYMVAFFTMVFIANVYMNLYARLRVGITVEKKEIELKEKLIEDKR